MALSKWFIRSDRAQAVSARKVRPANSGAVAGSNPTASTDFQQQHFAEGPTATLLGIRRKADKKALLSKPEWTFLVRHVQQGMENALNRPISSESFVGVLEAFCALYTQRTGHLNRNEYYIGNLSLDHAASDSLGDAAVLESVAATIRRVRESAQPFTPTFCSRNRYVFLDEEQFASAEAINEAMMPYWPVLWRVAARGHYLCEKKPIRDRFRPQGHLGQPSFLLFSEGLYKLSVTVGQNGEMHLLLSFPGPRGPMFPLGPYPKIAEFRAMLASLRAERKEIRRYQFDTGFWDGAQFFGYVLSEGESAGFWFRACENGITFGFSEDQWGQVQELFRKAWTNPDLLCIWEQLSQEYGEL